MPEERITTTRDYEGARVIDINIGKLIEDEDIQQFGNEIFSYLTPSSQDYDPAVDYCINFKRVEFLSAAALGKLITMDKKHKGARDNHLSLAEVKPEVYGYFEITKLNRLFTIYPTVNDFLANRAT